MESIEFIGRYTSYLTGFAAAAFTFSCIVTGYSYYTEGSEFGEIIKKISKKLRAAVILILITTIIDFFKRYWL